MWLRNPLTRATGVLLAGSLPCVGTGAALVHSPRAGCALAWPAASPACAVEAFAALRGLRGGARSPTSGLVVDETASRKGGLAHGGITLEAEGVSSAVGTDSSILVEIPRRSSEYDSEEGETSWSEASSSLAEADSQEQTARTHTRFADWFQAMALDILSASFHLTLKTKPIYPLYFTSKASSFVYIYMHACMHACVCVCARARARDSSLFECPTHEPPLAYPAHTRQRSNRRLSGRRRYRTALYRSHARIAMVFAPLISSFRS